MYLKALKTFKIKRKYLEQRRGMPKSEKEEKGNSKRPLKVCPKVKKKKKGIPRGC